MSRYRFLRLGGLALVLLPAGAFHATAEFMRLASEGRGPLFADFWMTQVHQGVGAWVYLVPALASGLVWLREMPGSGRPATLPVMLVYFVLASLLWAIALFGTIEPLANPEAVL